MSFGGGGGSVDNGLDDDDEVDEESRDGRCVLACGCIRGRSMVTHPRATAGNSYRCQKKSILCSIHKATVAKAVYPKPNGLAKW
jgi:hypothetical protein